MADPPSWSDVAWCLTVSSNTAAWEMPTGETDAPENPYKV
jgi:hypothetical protein